MPFRRRTLTRALSTAIAAAPALLGAQRPVPHPATMPGEWNIELETRERWLHGRQQSRFSPFAIDRTWLTVDSLRARGDSSRVYLTLGRSGNGRDSAIIEFDSTGRRVNVAAGFAPPVRPSIAFPGSDGYFADSQRRRSAATSTTEARLWDLVPTFAADANRVGARWTDTIARSVGHGAYRRALHGTRVSRISGDTVVAGRRLWIVRDSARVSYEESYAERERTLDTLVQISRVATGTVLGVELYDPALRLFRSREDTTRLVGDATLGYPDRRSFRTPARFERVRRWTLHDSTSYAARQRELRSAAERRSGGMVIVPRDDLERRLRAGDTSAADSLAVAWQLATDPDQAAATSALLDFWSAPDARRRFDNLRIAAGDTAFLYRSLASRAYPADPPIDTADVRAMLPFMRNPSLAWSFGLSRDELYENLAQALTTWPRAAAGPRGSHEACTIAACELLADERRTAREPRLRDVGLVALVSLDPARWGDTVLALDGPQHPLLHSAAQLVRGVGATWPASAKPGMPPPNSDWRAWLGWMNGWAPGDTVSHPNERGVRFEESHQTAIRFYVARTGRDIVGELRRAYAAATSDSARLVYGVVLDHMGELRLGADEIAHAFLSGVPERVTFARELLLSSFASAATPMDTAAAAPLIDRLLSALVDSTPLWRSGASDIRDGRWQRPAILAPQRDVILSAENLPSAVRARWGTRLSVMTAAEWSKRDPRAAGVFLAFAPVRVWGRFARVELRVSERSARSPAQAPAAYASGQTYYLMDVNGEWVVVAMDAWVT